MDDAGALPADGAAHDQTPVQLEGNKLVVSGSSDRLARESKGCERHISRE